MELADILSKRLNKEENLEAAKHVVNTPERFAELWTLIKTADPPIPFRAAWLMEKCIFYHPQLIGPHIPEMIEALSTPFHNGVHRGITKVLMHYPIPEAYHGQLYALCIDWILTPEKHVAIKVNCMDIAFEIAKNIPELLEELSIVIKDQMEFNTAAFTARGRKVLKQIEKINRL